MLRKGAFMRCPIIASRTSPTSAAVDLARTWNITLVGYARHGKLRVYCNPERLGFENKTDNGL
jgi:FdhD protein